MRTSDMIKSKFFGARDLQGQRPLTLIIAHVTEELFSRGSSPEMQYFLWFTNHQKGMKLNKTRVQVLETAYGPDSDLWTGRKVRLSFDPTVKFGNVPVGSIKVETEPGVIYSAPAGHPGWGGAPGSAPAAIGRPPAPVWDERLGQWVTQQPIASTAPPLRPPAPVWNEATGQWDTVNPSTGEIAPPQRAQTISERVNREHPPAEPGWGDMPPQSNADPEFGDPAIPF
jgi:hypothetical protein